MPTRLIPAHAGNTLRVKAPPTQARAHPRSRGEHSTSDSSGGLYAGSSPLTRGTQTGDYLHIVTTGLIPAHAGNTTSTR